MKPFNLEEAKSGKKVCLASGGKAEFIAFNDKYGDTGYYDKDQRKMIIAEVDYKDMKLGMCFDSNGLNVIEELRKYDLNLIMV